MKFSLPRLLIISAITLSPLFSFADDNVLAGTKRDEYTKSFGIATRNYVLPDEEIGSSFAHAVGAYATLLGKVTDTGQEGIEIRVFYKDPNGWAFLSQAHDSNGLSLPVHVVSRDVEHGSTVTEEIGIALTRDYLWSHRKSGTDIRVDGKQGQIFVKMPANYLEAFSKELEIAEAKSRSQMPIAGSASSKPKLGVGYLPVDATNAPVVGLSSPRGIIVARIDPGSLAEKAGFKQGDVILSADNQVVPPTLAGLPSVLGTIPAGKLVDFTIWRANSESHISVQF